MTKRSRLAIRNPDEFETRQKLNSKPGHGPAFGGVLYCYTI
jgi:hypothetical protein